MRTSRWLVTVGIALVLAAVAPLSWGGVALDQKTPDFTLTDTKGGHHSLSKYLKDDSTKAVVLDFWSKNCPISRSFDEELKRVHEKYKDQGVTFLAIDANHDETPQEMAEFAQSISLTVPILIDAHAAVADKYGAETTPHVYVVDSGGILRYTGAIADKGKTNLYLDTALSQILGGQPVAQAKTKHFGCAIKRAAAPAPTTAPDPAGGPPPEIREKFQELMQALGGSTTPQEFMQEQGSSPQDIGQKIGSGDIEGAKKLLDDLIKKAKAQASKGSSAT